MLFYLRPGAVASDGCHDTKYEVFPVDDAHGAELLCLTVGWRSMERSWQSLFSWTIAYRFVNGVVRRNPSLASILIQYGRKRFFLDVNKRCKPTPKLLWTRCEIRPDLTSVSVVIVFLDLLGYMVPLRGVCVT